MASIQSGNDSIEAQCDSCKKKQSELTNPLKRCAKCHSGHYCSRDCQKADWKSHKKSCGANSSQSDGGARSNSTFVNPFAALEKKCFFDDLPEEEAFAQIIDSYRLRVEDECMFQGETRGIYNQEHPRADFTEYLTKAHAAGVLPDWWNNQKKRACVAYGLKAGSSSNLNGAVEKSDIIEHYKNPLMPMQLRMVAEKVEGTNVYGQSIASAGSESGPRRPPWERRPGFDED